MRFASLSLFHSLLFLTQYIRYSQCTPSLSGTGARFSNQTALSGALSCWAEWDDYTTSSSQCPKTTITGSGTTWTTKVTSTIQETFKLCDGHPRAIATAGERTSTSLGEASGTPYTTYTIVMPPSGVPVSTETDLVTTTTTYLTTECISSVATPTCSIGDEECKDLFSSWTAGSYSRLRPPCTYALPTDPCDNCWIYIPSVKLIYFPVSMTGEFCGNYSTVTSNVSGPSTAVISGTTFTSGTAYLSYAGVTATAPNGNCGTTKPAGILPLPSSEVFSYRGHAAAMDIMSSPPYPFNFADLAPNPVPWDAWISQETCYTHQDYPSCQTITQAAYRPWIVYPSAFWSMNTQWSNCVSGIFGIMDPPTALQTAEQMARPTMPGLQADPSKTAAPKQDPSGGKVTATPSRQLDRTTQSLPPIMTMSKGLETPASVGTSVRIPEKSAATFQLDDQVYTLSPKGLLVGPDTTINLSPASSVTMDGHIIRMSRHMVWIDATSPVSSQTRQEASSQTADVSSMNNTVITTLRHGNSRLTISGYVNEASSTILSLGTTTVTYTGQNLLQSGTTYSTMEQSGSVTNDATLPKIVSEVSSTQRIASTTQATNASASASTSSAATSRSYAALLSLITVLVFAMTIL